MALAQAVRHLLDTHGVWYEERNASTDSGIFQELLRETRQPFVPTLKIGGAGNCSGGVGVL